MIRFRNPQMQPRSGVYCWWGTTGGNNFLLYVGSAGKKNGSLQRCTLLRGVSELARTPFASSSKGKRQSLDTDFVVGTVIKLVQEKFGWDCEWEHLCDDPSQEITYIRNWKPILQKKNGHLHESLLSREEKGYWQVAGRKTESEKEDLVKEAERRIDDALQALMAIRNVAQ